MTPRRSIIPIFVPHLGCPHMCVFCNQRRISGSSVPADAETVKAEIELALSKIPDSFEKTVAFYGGSFTAIPVNQQNELLLAVEPYMKKGYVNSIRLSTRPDCIDNGILDRLYSFGVKTIELGVQSMCDDVLMASGRGHRAEDAVNASKLIKSFGFELILQQMTGLPEDTAEKSIYTAKSIMSLSPDGVRIYPTVIIKDTELYDMWKRGEYKEHTVEDAVSLCSILLDMYEENNIPVIRLGLNPTDELSGGDAVGGAYHPALRELCEGRRFLNRELSFISSVDRDREVVFMVPRGKISQAVGQKRCNVNYIIEKFGVKSVKFIEGDLPAGKIMRI